MPKFATIAYNMKWYLRLCTFIFWILSNLAKYIGLLPLEHHQKIGKKIKTVRKTRGNRKSPKFWEP
jgi:hypothetical protein